MIQDRTAPAAGAAERPASSKGASQRCVRCIIDTTVPGVTFDNEGVCSFCHLHEKLEKLFPLGPAGERQLHRLIEKITREGRGKKYDCIMGISGGRDSTYTLYLAKKLFNLRPLAVHFNNGFGNPVAGENMVKAAKKLDVELRTVTSDWREAKDLKIVGLKASTPDLDLGTDIGIATALYGAAVKENIRYLLIGQSFRTEGIAPLSWNYLDGRYLHSMHQRFGKVPLRSWKPADPGFHLDLPQLAYYVLWKRVKTIPILYYQNYVRSEAEVILRRELGWVYPGAHYYDDLYQSLLTYVLRVKFNIDRRIFNYSALVRSGQMSRDEALKRVREVYVIEDPQVIDLCIKRLGMTREEFDLCVASPPKTFRDYPNCYGLIKKFKPLIGFLCKFHILPGSAYDKYFNCGA